MNEALMRATEAILFVSGEPVQADMLAHALNLTRSELDAVLENLADHLNQSEHGIRLNRNGESVYLSIKPELAPQVEAFLQPLKKMPLSQAVMETLSIVAYRQPVTKADIEAIRGVKCDYSIQSLLNKGFIREAGRREILGRPIEYATTDEFLRHFGIESIEQLPAVDLPKPEVSV